MKPFNSYSQQLKILRSRNLITCETCLYIKSKNINKCTECKERKRSSKALRILEKDNYYSVINGYKDMFLVSRADNGEVYRVGSTIFEIYELYCLDRKLRTLLLDQILCYEHHLKSNCSYYFTENNQAPNAYLNYTSYEGTSSDVIKVIESITTLISSKNKKGSPIDHYIKTHSSIPLWVIANHFTFGNARYFYSVCPNKVKRKIADSLNKHLQMENPRVARNANVQIDIQTIIIFNILVNYYRNICAHNERLYNERVHEYRELFKQKKTSNYEKLPRQVIKEISEFLKIGVDELKQGSFFTMISLLKLFSSKNQYLEFLNNVNYAIDSSISKINSFKKSHLLDAMGFGSYIDSWKYILEK